MNVALLKHDCDVCVFLGHRDGHDLFYHGDAPETLVARYGDDGPDYLSAPPGIIGSAVYSPALVAAKRMAQARGLITIY